MIIFLKKIRRRLLAGGETLKYLKYALGEIILVVIGILIALSINNWNLNRQKRQTELKIYQNLKEQITNDSLDIQGQIRFNGYFNSQYELGIEIIENNDRSQLDTLAIIVANLTQYSDFDRDGNIHETLVNSGDINLIKNEDIIKSIIYLEEDLMYMNRMEAIHFEAMMDQAIPTIKDVMKFSNMKIVKPDEVYSYEFQNLFFFIKRIADEKEFVYKDALRRIGELNVLIEEELKRR